MSQEINNMFSQIAKRYDLMNNLLSFGIHKLWKKKTVQLSGAKPGDPILDCASGTGDLAIQFKKVVGSYGKVIASDFNEDMLAIANEKFKKLNYQIEIKQADALNLPFPDNTFDVSSIGFGIRNVDSTPKCIEEMARVVKPGGRVVILEFGQPKGFFRHIYSLYNKTILPLLAKLLTDSEFAYNYLTDSASKYPCREDFLDIMKSTNKLSDLEYWSLTFGIAYIYVGIVR